LGASATQVVAVGLLAYNFFAGIVAPIAGLNVQMIGMDPTPQPSPPIPPVASIYGPPFN